MKPIVKMEHCYGITEFNFNFDFSDKKTYCIYAPNGVMKTSFAKSFYDYQTGGSPSEKIFGNPTCFSVDSEGLPLDPEKIVVIKSYIDQYESIEALTSILVDQDNRKKYDSAKKSLDSKMTTFRVKLNKLSGIVKTKILPILKQDFGYDNLFDFIEDIDFSKLDKNLSDIKMSLIFNADVLKLLENPEVAENIDTYVKTYNKIISKNRFYKQGVFTPINAQQVLKSLGSQKFFDAENFLKLNGLPNDLDLEGFQEAFDQSIEEIVKNPLLTKVKESIKKIAVVTFQKLLEEKPWLLTKLEKTVRKDFKIELWYSYLKSEEVFISELLEIYKSSIAAMKEVEERALEQVKEREKVVDIFKNRFETPYTKIDITNKRASAIGNEVPNLIFEFINPLTGESKELPRKELDGLQVLSQGEKRVLYLLGVIYDIESRKSKGETLFIVDDIADSFDYRNKYAIIEYLKEISDENGFYQIILTHNFDFFRTVSMRVVGNRRSSSYVATKTNSKISLKSWTNEELLNPFFHRRPKIPTDSDCFVASIPYVRELIKYKEGESSENYILVTALLHFKENQKYNTLDILVSDLLDIYNSYLGVDLLSGVFTRGQKVSNIIFQQAQTIALKQPEDIVFISKIILSMGIRIIAEKYIIAEVSDKSPINGMQWGKLFRKYKTEFGSHEAKRAIISVLESVNLMTPENIHINSFMYEPIIDLGVSHLLKLYNDCQNLDSL